ncbi:MAG: glutamine synthetase [Chloroflexi bacterium]|nr:glutamine synthetase [Chloroflexota bacterium]MBV9596621.1 glutamine synthetase [Chloroflexota bacterium]
MTGIVERAHAAGIEVVHLQFTDVPGAIKSLTIPASRLERTLQHGAWFDGSSVEGLARTAESDLFLQPDAHTFAVVPWEKTPTARLICDVHVPGGAPFSADPRQALKSVLAEAAELGFDYRVSIEVEFYVFEDRELTGPSARPLAPVDRSGYFEVQEVRAANLCREATDALRDFGVEVEASHAEVGPGQHEIDIADMAALEAADAVVALKWALRSLARRAGMLVSFMPKPLEEAPGSGLHISQALVDRARGDAFSDPAERYELSEAAAQFIAGQLAHARGLSAVVAPLVNSYKRLAGGAEAPARVSWARIHRGALIRVPEAAAGRGTRLELRAPDPSCNPYLALAAMLKTGLDGIRNQLPLSEPADELGSELDTEGAEAADPLPATLGEALEELNWDPVVRDALGQPIFERFLTAKEQEWQAFGRHISSWELARYLEGA